ncbi:hydratase [Prosthecomicrobium sp. N25]|uniref:hydratase n=1 Tax=Prosthecomicrobium sp. N25 TaxID=3129254 RepID=UPI003077D62F
MGSVFSPYYAWARRRGGGLADPENHCAINVCLYGARGRWAMTERGRRHMVREPARLQVGPSAVAWDGRALVIDVDETTVPVPRRLKGRIRLTPLLAPGRSFEIGTAGAHVWRPIAPRARVEVRFDSPALAWDGDGYLDMNEGREPLEAGFRSWHWSRAPSGDGALVLYDMLRRDGTAGRLALGFEADGTVRDLEPPPELALPRTGWRVARAARSDPGAPPAVLRTLEDTPFYARSLVSSTIRGRPVTAMHESLDLDRFAAPIVQAMLPFRMPRRS